MDRITRTSAMVTVANEENMSGNLRANIDSVLLHLIDIKMSIAMADTRTTLTGSSISCLPTDTNEPANEEEKPAQCENSTTGFSSAVLRANMNTALSQFLDIKMLIAAEHTASTSTGSGMSCNLTVSEQETNTNEQQIVTDDEYSTTACPSASQSISIDTETSECNKAQGSAEKVTEPPAASETASRTTHVNINQQDLVDEIDGSTDEVMRCPCCANTVKRTETFCIICGAFFYL